MEHELQIKKGAFHIARKLFDSELWQFKPSSWIKIWIYILGHVNHTKRGKFERGEGFFYWTHIIKHEQLGKDITIDCLKSALRHFKENHMICSSRSTRGTKIKVLNYNVYQSLDTYINTRSNTNQTLETLHDTQELKNEKNNTSVAIATPFEWSSYLKEMSTDKRKHIRIIASYFGRRKKSFKSQAEASEAVKRHLRAAISVSKFDREDIVKAMNKCEEMKDIDWTLETTLKVLTK